MKYYIKLLIQKLLIVLLFPFRIFPIKKNRIIFLSLEGGSRNEYSCNPKYVYEYIHAKATSNYEFVWLFQHPEQYQFLKDTQTKIASYFSFMGFYYALTSRFVITNGGYLTWFPFRKGQLCVNTWHGGGAYKKIETDMQGANSATRKRMDHASKHTSLFLSSSEAFTNCLIKGAYHYQGEILKCGMPRNDILLSNKKEVIAAKLKSQYQLPKETNLLLFAPTFREQLVSYPPLSVSRILDLLEEQTGCPWVFGSRMHTKAKQTDLLIDMDARFIDLSDAPDTQEVLCAADLLITDYSSIVWDYAITGNPCLLYTPDLEEYLKFHGFYEDIHNWKLPLCSNMTEVEQVLHELSAGLWTNATTLHLDYFNSYEDGLACEQLYNWIKSH